MQSGLSTIDGAIVVLYFALIAGIGFRVSRGQASTRDYFLGGRSLPWWAATLSIIATETSAVTFIGLPRAAYAGDWSVLQLFLGFALGRVFLAMVFVKAFYRSEHVTVYGYLSERFGPRTRTTAAVLFILGRLVASGVRLFAGCLAVHVATGLPIEASVLALGLFGTAFTLLGGIRAVVWTDVVLGLTLAGGAIFSILFLIDSTPGGIGAVLSSPLILEKVRVFRFDLAAADGGSFLAGLLGGFVLTLATHGTDQDVAQRMLTCRDARQGRFSVLGSAILIVPLALVFLAVGTLLWFQRHLGTAAYPEPDDLNHVFPLYIATGLPAGAAGIVMAGLLAAAVSSFTSVLNALAATTIGDFYAPWTRGSRRTERHYVRASRIATAFWALALMGSALAFIGSRESIIEVALAVLTYFYGGLLGAFLLGILSRRGGDLSMAAGMVASVPVVLLLQLRQFLAKPETAPDLIQTWLSALSPATKEALLRNLPEIAWPYWILIGVAVSMSVGALARFKTG